MKKIIIEVSDEAYKIIETRAKDRKMTPAEYIKNGWPGTMIEEHHYSGKDVRGDKDFLESVKSAKKIFLEWDSSWSQITTEKAKELFETCEFEWQIDQSNDLFIYES